MEELRYRGLPGSLIRAVIEGKVHKVRHLLSQGAILTSKSAQGVSPLVAALHVDDAQKRRRLFVMLLRTGASFTARDSRYLRSVMHWACALGRSEQVSALVEETAGNVDLSERDKDGLTALHHAVLSGSLATVNTLVDMHVRFGVPVDAPDNLGLTPYIYARRLAYKEIAQVLQSKGLACGQHADNMFRSPSVWSIIGKTERTEALNYQIQSQVRTAKIMGKCHFTKQLGSSLQVTSLKSKLLRDNSEQSNALHKRSTNGTLKSPPYLDTASAVKNIGQSTSPEGQHHSKFGLPTKKTTSRSSATDNNFKTKQDTNLECGTTPSPHNPQVFSEGIDVMHDGTTSQIPQAYPMNHHGQVQRLTLFPHPRPPNHQHKDEFNQAARLTGQHIYVSPNTHPAHLDPGLTISSSSALSLIEQTFPKSPVANEFHNSVLDKSKMAEYNYILGDLNGLMGVLSEQNTKSFRASVKRLEPVTPKAHNDIKKRVKISSWSILFGEKKDTRQIKTKPLDRSHVKGIDNKERAYKYTKEKLPSQTHVVIKEKSAARKPSKTKL